jgi:hypothetical protein
MPKSPGRRSSPTPGSYRPHVAARRPGGRPAVKPAFRVLVHHKYLAVWNELADRVGLANAQQFWDHVAMTPGQPPKVGTSSLRYSLGLAVNGMWACELGFSLAGLLVGVHLMGAGCVMGNGLGAVRVSGDRMLVRHLSRRADRGRACLRRRLADLRGAGRGRGAGLLHRDDSGHRLGGGTGRGAAGVLRRVMRASPGPSA